MATMTERKARRAREDSAERILYLIKSGGPQTARALAESLGITTMGTRQHLDRLTTEGLVTASQEKRPLGRPVYRWSLTDAGNARFPDSHAKLTVDLIASVKSVFGDDGLERLVDDRTQQSLHSYQAALATCSDLSRK